MRETAAALVILVPFLGGIFALLAGDRWRDALGLMFSFFTVVPAVSLALGAERTLRYQISGWPVPLGISLHIDGLALAMLLLSAAVGGCVSLYALSYFRDASHAYAARAFWTLYFFLWGALNTIFLVSDLFTIYVCLELITLISVALITVAADLDALKAALAYLMTALMGSLAYLLGVALIYSKTGTLDWTLASASLGNDPVSWAALSLVTAGLLVKSALFPLHFWLPGAHSVAPAPVSAMLSALVVKASFFVMLRIWVQTFPDFPYASHFLGILGSGAIIWGSFRAIFQERIKLMVAYSTVAQLGYLFLLFPLLSAAAHSDLSHKADIWHGGIYFALSHGVAKAAMFLAAGILLHATDTDHLQEMRGAANRVPVAVMAWGLAGISLIGLPPSGGFIAKWQLLTSAIRFEQWFYAAVILFGGLLASGYVFRVFWYAFLEAESPRPTHKVPFLMLAPAILLGILVVVMGVRTAGVFELLRIGSPFAGGGP